MLIISRYPIPFTVRVTHWLRITPLFTMFQVTVKIGQLTTARSSNFSVFINYSLHISGCFRHQIIDKTSSRPVRNTPPPFHLTALLYFCAETINCNRSECAISWIDGHGCLLRTSIDFAVLEQWIIKENRWFN